MRFADEDHANRSEIRALWRTVRLVLASAYVEHARLTGREVAGAELALRESGSAPWRDLIGSSSDSETVEQVPCACADEDHAPLVVLSLTAPIYRPSVLVRLLNRLRKEVK